MLSVHQFSVGGGAVLCMPLPWRAGRVGRVDERIMLEVDIDVEARIIVSPLAGGISGGGPARG